MDSPVLTAGEEAAINAAIEAIKVSQAARDKPVQVLMNDANGIISLGVPESIVAAAAPAGFEFAVHEYEGPFGRGWILEVQLDRDGKWLFKHHEGQEVRLNSENGWQKIIPIGGV